MAVNASGSFHVKAAFFIQPPFVEPCARGVLRGDPTACKNGKRPGFNVETFLFMAQILNFTYEVMEGDGIGAPDKNGYWGESMLGFVHRGEADMSINTPWQNYARGQIVKYLNPTVKNVISVLIPTPTIKVVDTLFLPFSRGTWGLLFGVTILTAVVKIGFIAIQIYTFKEDKSNESVLRRMKKAVEESLLCMYQEGPPADAKESYRHFHVSWQLVAMVMAQVYAEGLFFEFKNNQWEIPFGTVDQFATKVETGEYKVMIPRGINQFLGNVLNVTVASDMLHLKRAIAKHPPKVLIDKDRYDAPTMMQQDTAFVDIGFIQDMMVMANCSLLRIELFGMKTNIGSVVFRDGFPHFSKFNDITHLIRGQAAYVQYQKYVKVVERAECYFEAQASMGPLTLTHLRLTFRVMMVGMAVSVFAYILAWVQAMFCTKVTKKSNTVTTLVEEFKPENVQEIH